MKTTLVVVLLLAVGLVLVTGCRTHPGSREYIPGKGWVPN